MKKVLCLIILMYSVLSASANDGTYYTSGNHLVPLMETDVNIKKEILTISILDNRTAKIDVYYEFYNPNATTKTVVMGFEADPPYNDEYKLYANGRHPHIMDFTVEQNGMNVPYRTSVCYEDITNLQDGLIDVSQYSYDENSNRLIRKGHNEDDGIDFAYVYYFNMSFKPGINKVHHTYRYTMTEIVGTLFEVEYKLSPAARWANKQIDDFTLVIRADNTAKHFIINPEIFEGTDFHVTEGTGKIRDIKYNDSPYREYSLRNGAITLHKTNFVPENELYIYSANMMTSFDETAPYGSFYDRSMFYSYESWTMMGNRINKLSPAFAKRVMRNLPFAHRGHVFSDAALRKYFESLWWYMPDPTYKDDVSDFTTFDNEYIREGKK